MLRIEGAELFLVPLRLREPFATAAGATRERSVLLLALHGGGAVGWSECVARETPDYSAETTETAWHVLTRWLLPAVAGGAYEDGPGSVLAPVAWVRGNRMAKAAVEMAAWDLHAKQLGVPLCEALGGTRRPVPAGVSIGFQPDMDVLCARIEGFLAEGYRRVKLKIGPGRDVAVLSAVLDRFPGAAFAVDANGAYTLTDLAPLRAIDDLGLTMIEQPLAPEDLRDHARLQEALRTPLCLDESIRSVEDTRLGLELGSFRVVNLKPGRVGGFGEARAIHDLCLGRGVPLWCGGMLESGVGRAHNVALATLPGFTLPGDLSASRRYWERDLVDPEWELCDGMLQPLDAPGIGVEPDRSRIEALAVRHEALAPPSGAPSPG